MSIQLISCTSCGGSFSGSSNAMYCSNKCKQKAYRSKRTSGGFIYRLKKCGKVVYIGQSITERGVKNRISDHTYGEQKKDFDEYECYEVLGVRLNDAEADEIVNHKPIYNKRLPSTDNWLTPKQLCLKVLPLVESLVSEYYETHAIGGDNGNTYISLSDKQAFEKKIKDLMVNIP